MNDENCLCKLVGKNIKELRKLSGYQQGQFAKLLGITQTTMSKIENGETDIKIGIIEKASKILEKPIQDFIFESETLVLSKEDLKKLLI